MNLGWSLSNCTRGSTEEEATDVFLMAWKEEVSLNDDLDILNLSKSQLINTCLFLRNDLKSKSNTRHKDLKLNR